MTAIQARFDEVSAQYDEKIRFFAEKKAKLEQELADLRSKFNQLMVADVENPTKQNSADLAKIQKRVQDVLLEINMMDSRVQIVEGQKEKALANLYDELDAMHNEIAEKATVQITEDSTELFLHRIKTLLKLKELHDIGLEAMQAHRELESIASRLGIPFNKRFFQVPQLNLFSQYTGTDAALLSLPDESSRAYQAGAVPPFVEWYDISGEIKDSVEARRLLKEHDKQQSK